MLGGPLHTLGSSSHTYIIENLYVERERKQHKYAANHASTQRIGSASALPHARIPRTWNLRRPGPRSNCTRRSRVVCRRLRLCASAQRPATVELWQLAVRRRRVGHSGGSRRRVGHRSALRRSFDNLAFGAARPHGPGGPGRQDVGPGIASVARARSSAVRCRLLD